MPINGLQKRLSQVGVIRLGEQLISRNNKPYPSKLLAFRFTTPSPRIAEALAGLFGGSPRPWQNTTGPEWEVYSTASEIEVLVPPQFVDPNYEMWGPGVQLRVCDGVTERKRQCPCICAEDYGPDFSRTAPKPKICKVTYRVSLMIADLPSLGTWKLEGHGWGGAAEIPETVNTIRNAPMPIPGRLMLVHKKKGVYNARAEKGKEIEQRDYVQPVLDISAVTPIQAYTNQLAAAARRALGGADELPALDSKPAAPPAAHEPTLTTAEWIALIEEASTAVGLDELRGRMQAAKVRDQVVVDAWMAKAAMTAPAKPAVPAPAARRAPAPAADAPKGEIVDAVVVGPDTPMTGGAAWTTTMEIAGRRGWNRATIAGLFLDTCGFDYRDDKATDEVLVEFLDKLQRGEVNA